MGTPLSRWFPAPIPHPNPRTGPADLPAPFSRLAAVSAYHINAWSPDPHAIVRAWAREIAGRHAPGQLVAAMCRHVVEAVERSSGELPNYLWCGTLVVCEWRYDSVWVELYADHAELMARVTAPSNGTPVSSYVLLFQEMYPPHDTDAAARSLAWWIRLLRHRTLRRARTHAAPGRTPERGEQDGAT